MLPSPKGSLSPGSLLPAFFPSSHAACSPGSAPRQARAVPCRRTGGECCRASGAFQPGSGSGVSPPAQPPAGSQRRTPASPSAVASRSPGPQGKAGGRDQCKCGRAGSHMAGEGVIQVIVSTGFPVHSQCWSSTEELEQSATDQVLAH